MIQSEEITNVTIHPDGEMNVCTEFHVSPSNSCLDILLKTINVNLMVALEEKSSSLSVQNFVATHPIIVDKCLSGPNRPTSFTATSYKKEHPKSTKKRPKFPDF